MGLLEKDASKRMHITEAFDHPWVTAGGTAPLPWWQAHQTAQPAPATGAGLYTPFSADDGQAALSGVKPRVSQEELDSAVQQIDGSLAHVMDWVFEEVHYQDG